MVPLADPRRLAKRLLPGRGLVNNSGTRVWAIGRRVGLITETEKKDKRRQGTSAAHAANTLKCFDDMESGTLARSARVSDATQPFQALALPKRKAWNVERRPMRYDFARYT